MDVRVNVFEVNIRLLGGLLSGHLLAADPATGPRLMPGGYDGGLLVLAQDLGRRLLPAFHESPTGARQAHPAAAESMYPNKEPTAGYRQCQAQTWSIRSAYVSEGPRGFMHNLLLSPVLSTPAFSTAEDVSRDSSDCCCAEGLIESVQAIYWDMCCTHSSMLLAGLPIPWVNLRYGIASNELTSSNTAACGTFILEFGLLTRLTGAFTLISYGLLGHSEPATYVKSPKILTAGRREALVAAPRRRSLILTALWPLLCCK